MEAYLYDAFISYSHRDLKWGKWLQRKLEGFHCPRDVREGPESRKDRGSLRIFRDQTDLAGAKLQESLNRELEQSRYLIVICSPSSAASRWVDAEIRHFCSLGRENRILPFIVAGEPNSDQPELECFPPALREENTGELLGVNIQEIGKNKAFLKTASVLLDIRFNRLVDREKQRKRRTGLTIGAISAVVAGVTGFLIWNNAEIKKENSNLTFDIYGAAMLSLQLNDTMQPEELAFLQASAEEGNAQAMVLLGDCLKNGWGTAEDPEAAFGWFRKAAEADNSTGMIAVANCYASGIGTEPDPEQCFRWNMQAADLKEDSAGMVNVASCYQEGFGTEQDTDLAFQWYGKAAKAGNELGLFQLALCYLTGTGTEPDKENAFATMKTLAEKYNPDGMYNLALMYQAGFGTEEDPELAYTWYRRAADIGDARSMRMVGWCIENRYGIDDPALDWYMRAAAAGDEGAKEDAARRQEQNSEAAGKDSAAPGTDSAAPEQDGEPQESKRKTSEPDSEGGIRE